MTTEKELQAEIEVLRERVLDLEIDLGRVAQLFGFTIDDVSEVVSAIRSLKAKEGDVSVNAMLSTALRLHPDLAVARDAIDRVLLNESGRPAARETSISDGGHIVNASVDDRLRIVDPVLAAEVRRARSMIGGRRLGKTHLMDRVKKALHLT